MSASNYEVFVLAIGVFDIVWALCLLRLFARTASIVRCKFSTPNGQPDRECNIISHLSHWALVATTHCPRHQPRLNSVGKSSIRQIWTDSSKSISSSPSFFTFTPTQAANSEPTLLRQSHRIHAGEDCPGSSTTCSITNGNPTRPFKHLPCQHQLTHNSRASPTS